MYSGQRESGRGSHAEDGGSPRALPRDPGRLLQSVNPETFFPVDNGHPPTLVCSACARSSNHNIGGERQRERLRLAARVVDDGRDSRVFMHACEGSIRGGGALLVGPAVEANSGSYPSRTAQPPATAASPL